MLENRFKPILLKRQGVALGVWGEAGIGKSHRVQELLQTLPCRSLSLHAATPLATLAHTLPRPRKLATWAERTLERLGRGEAVETSSVLDTLGATLAGLAPFVLHLEDSHETDSERLAFFQKLAQMVQRSKGVGLVITSRSEPPEPFTPIRLEPLTSEQSNSLLEREGSATLPKEALEFIYRHAAGNPLYTLEYFRLLSRQGSLWNDGKNWHWRKPEESIMPVTVEALLELALEKVQDEKPLTALQAKAYLALEASDALWQNVAELSEADLAAAKRDLEQRSIFKDDTFAHPLYREVSLKNLPKAKRQTFARRALEMFRDDLVKTAPFIEDAELENEQALGLLKGAARQARATKDDSLAGRLLAKAVHYATGEERGQLALEAATALEGVDYQKMFALAEQALNYLPDGSEALSLMAKTLALQGKYDDMQQVIERIPEASRRGAKWATQYLGLLHTLEKYDERITFWENHPDLQEACSGEVIYLVAWAYINVGKTSVASELIERSLQRPNLTTLDKCSLLEIWAMLSFYTGSYEQAESTFSEALTLRQELGMNQKVASLLGNRSVARLVLGRFRETLPDFQQSLEIFAETGNSLYYGETLMLASYAYFELGNYERTEEVLLEARAIYTRIKPLPTLVHILTQLTELYLAWPSGIHHYLALKYARETENAAREVDGLYARLLAASTLAQVELDQGDAQKGLEYAQEALELAKSMNILQSVIISTAVKGRALASLGQLGEAKETFTTAYLSAKENNLVLEKEKIALELDRLNHDLESARERLKWFQERGLMNCVNLAKRYFPELAEQPIQLHQETSSPLRLDVLGTMQLSQDGKTEVVRGRKRQEFLGLLLEARLAGRAEVDKLTLLDALYSNEAELKAQQSLRTLINALRSSFGESIILTTSTGYRLGAMNSDAETFLGTGDSHLWRGAYLEGLETQLQITVQESLYLTLFERAKALLETDPPETARVTRLLLSYDPYNPQYLTLGLQALQRERNYKTLGRVYRTAKERFAELGEHLPTHWTTFLATYN